MLNMVRKWHFISVVLLIIILDQISKYLILINLQLHEVVALFPGLNLALTYNNGAAFGILHSAGGWQRWFFIGLTFAICSVIIIWHRKLAVTDRLEACALAFILGGALGNLGDRLQYGFVVDFIDFYIANWHWYTFNIADSAICLGALLLFVVILSKERKSAG